MKITKYRQEELEQARELQKKARELHLPSPPVISWEATIVDKHGVEKESITSKCNSYVRNGLNMIAQGGLCGLRSINAGTVYDDGFLTYKDTLGTVVNWQYGHMPNYSAVTSPYIALGDDDTAESIDHFEFSNIDSIANVTRQPLAPSVSFDGVNRKLITVYQTKYTNASVSDIVIKEAGVLSNALFKVYNSALASGQYLLVRDLLVSPITLLAGEFVFFNYKFEVLY